MMCQKMGRLPIGTIALGRDSVSSRHWVPFPPHRMTTFLAAAVRQAIQPRLFKEQIGITNDQFSIANSQS